MCDFFVDLAQVCAGCGATPDRFLHDNRSLQALVDDGLVRADGTKIAVDSDARFIVRKVAAAFDAYLDRPRRTYSTAA